MIQRATLDQITQRFQFLEAKLAGPLSPDEIAALTKEYSDLRPVAGTIERYRAALDQIDEAQAMLADPEMRAMAEEELFSLRAGLEATEAAVKLALLPRDAADAKPAMIEIRPGTGGDEAALFAADLMRMYQRYAEARGWRFEVIEEQATELGGIKEAVVRVEGENVFARLKYESGVHRVQRVPETESGGRIHTSAATVAVLPEAEDVEIDIPATDIRIDTMRSSGAGGQHVNTTNSAVRITHIPSGIVVTSSQKSQHRNRELAMNVLKSRLYDLEQGKLDDARAGARRAQVGTGDRSERIRTYNFPQGRMTDHRINLTLYRLEAVLGGDLDEIIDALTAEAQALALADLEGQG